MACLTSSYSKRAAAKEDGLASEEGVPVVLSAEHFALRAFSGSIILVHYSTEVVISI